MTLSPPPIGREAPRPRVPLPSYRKARHRDRRTKPLRTRLEIMLTWHGDALAEFASILMENGASVEKAARLIEWAALTECHHTTHTPPHEHHPRPPR